MTKIATSPTSIVTGASADGRITYASVQNGPTIDGRPAWRGRYINPQTGYADDSMPVDPADWAAACELMHAVDGVAAANSERNRRADLDALNARYEAIEEAMDLAARGRGSHYDVNVRKSN